MHNNYFFIRQLVKELNEQLPGFKLVECFSQNKDEAIFSFVKPDSQFHIVAHLTGQFSCLAFPEEYSKARKNTATIFKQLIGLKVKKACAYENERALNIQFEDNYSLIVKMFGRQSNIILLRDKVVIELFKKSYKADHELQEENLVRAIDQSREAVLNALPDYRQVFPTLDKKLIKLIDEEIKGKSHEDATSIILDHVHRLNNPKGYYINEGYPPSLKLSEKGIESDLYTSALEASTRFFFRYLREKNFYELRTRLLQDVERSIGKTEVYLAKTRRKAGAIQDETNYKMLADIIMANLHNIAPNVGSVVLPNIYAEGENITIKLNSLLSPQQNAQRYYKKAKNVSLEIANLEESIASKEKLLTELRTQNEAIENAQDIKALRKLSKTEVVKETTKEVPFKKFNIAGYTVYVGNNAKQNDLLTLKYAKKDDLFFHAKDVSGSHVILKQKPGGNVPVAVLEVTASLAAYYSKRKTDTLCPVGYTEKKYVRKPKGSPPGLVLVEREKVLLVPPQLPEPS